MIALQLMLLKTYILFPFLTIIAFDYLLIILD